MKLDKNYRVPDGFAPILNYSNDPVNGEPVVGECLLKIEGSRGLRFWIGESIPVLPLKAKGELWHTGWDIPTYWAVDGCGQCWMDNAHGHCLCPVLAKTLLGEAEEQNMRNVIRKILGMPPEEPEWMALARAAGWKPHEVK